MAIDKKRATFRNANNVQNVEVSGMRAKGSSARKNENGVRYINGKRLLAHYRHLSKMEEKAHSQCVICTKGFSAAYHVTKGAVPESGVAEGAGVDEKRDGPLSHLDEWINR